MKGLVTHKLPDPAWGFPSVARVIPNDDTHWGRLQFLVGTEWEQFFPRIPVGILDMALRGHATPLMKILGPPPRGFLKRLPVAEGLCAQRRTCISHTALCVPAPRSPCVGSPRRFRAKKHP